MLLNVAWGCGAYLSEEFKYSLAGFIQGNFKLCVHRNRFWFALAFSGVLQRHCLGEEFPDSLGSFGSRHVGDMAHLQPNSLHAATSAGGGP